MAKIKMSNQSYANLVDAERKLMDSIPEFDKLEECGEDCTALRDMVRYNLERIAKMKQYYSP